MILRIRFTKQGKVRFTSHRDVARIWERALRRARVPVTYTEGYSPRPRLGFGLALPTGAESVGEYLDVRVDEDRPGPSVDELPALLDAGLPEGIAVPALVVLEPRMPSLQQAVTACTWSIRLPGTAPAALALAAERVLAEDEIVVTRERKGKQVTDDLRPSIRSLAVLGTPDGGSREGSVLEAELATQGRGIRPGELFEVLADRAETGADPSLAHGARVCRLHQWIEADGHREEPVALPGAGAQRAEVRAS